LASSERDPVGVILDGEVGWHALELPHIRQYGAVGHREHAAVAGETLAALELANARKARRQAEAAAVAVLAKSAPVAWHAATNPQADMRRIA
jgi:hypothetical protein